MVDYIYIIKKGVVKLQKKMYITGSEGNPPKNPKMTKAQNMKNLKTAELATKQDMQTFAEEFIYVKCPAEYSVITQSHTLEM